MNDQLERAFVTQPDRREVPDISCCEASDAQVFGKHYNGRIDQAEAEVTVAAVDLVARTS